MNEQDIIDLKLQLNRIEEKLDVIAKAKGEPVKHWEDPAPPQRKTRSLLAVLLFLVVFAVNWIMVFGTLPTVIDLPTGIISEHKHELLLALRYLFVLVGVPLVHWLAPDVCVATFVGFIAGHLGVRDLAYGYSSFSVLDERALYLQVYKIGAVISLVSFVGIKLARGLK